MKLIVMFFLCANIFINWQNQPAEFISNEGKFAINFPDTPELTEQPITLNGVASRCYNYTVTKDNVIYRVSYSDHDTLEFKTAPSKNSFIYVASKAFIKNFNSELYGGIFTTFNQYAGRSIKVYSTDQFAYSRFYLVEQRLYQITVITDRKTEQLTRAEVLAFLDSFKLIDDSNQLVTNKARNLKDEFDPSASTRLAHKSTSSSQPPEENVVMSGTAGVISPKILQTKKPSYTDEAKKRWVEGVVIISAVFRKNGDVTDLKLVNSLGYGLDEEAMKAAKKVKFDPGLKENQPVNIRAKMEYTFSLY